MARQPAPAARLDDRWLILGRARNGTPLELAAIVRSNGSLLVIHAMPARRRYRALIEEFEQWAAEREPTYGWDRRGNPITEEYVADAVREAEAGYDLKHLRPVGRPSLRGEARHSPRVSFRVTDDLRGRAEAEAARRGCSVSQLAREALERYLAS